MSKVLMSRLAMLEVLDTIGPCTVSELAAGSGLDLSVVSRTVAACERDGWIHRDGSRLTVGPRAMLLGNAGPFAEIVSRASPIVHAVAGATGLTTHAYALVGRETVALSIALGRGQAALTGLAIQAPLYATAGGRAIASQLTAERLTAVLPSEPFPSPAEIFHDTTEAVAQALSLASRLPPASTPPESLLGFADTGPGHSEQTLASQPQLVRTAADLGAELEQIRREGIAFDRGELIPGIHCVAVPWPQPALPAAFVCLGPADEVDRHAAQAAATLRHAAQAGATPASILAMSVAAAPSNGGPAGA